VYNLYYESKTGHQMLYIYESTYGGRVNPSEIGYSPDDQADLPELGYSPDGPLTKLIKPKCPNKSHM